MRRIVLTLVLLGALVLAASASAAAPPSFARWATAWQAASDRAINAALDPCQKHYVDNGLKAGTCTVRNVRQVYARVMPIWDRAVDRVAQRQTAGCRSAIHGYWLAARTQQQADLAYLRTHPRVTVTQLNVDLSGAPFATMSRVAANAKQRAIRICG